MLWLKFFILYLVNLNQIEKYLSYAQVCNDGSQPAGACVSNKCGFGFYCNYGICCKNLYSQTPKCLNGNEASSACYKNVCGYGNFCTTGNLCCPITTTFCPQNLYYITDCLNGNCPSGYFCYSSGGPDSYCCGTTEPITCSAQNSIGMCTNNVCSQGFSCDVLNNRCCPNLGVTIGPCYNGGCPSATTTTSTCPTTTTASTITTTTEAMEFVCDSEWTYFQPTNSCYKEWICILKRKSESAFLVDFSKSGLTADATEVYIGLTNPGPPCTTYSWTDGTPFDYQNFAVINTCANGECTRMFPDQTVTMPTPAIGSWIGLTCSVPLRGYICKKSAQSI